MPTKLNPTLLSMDNPILVVAPDFRLQRVPAVVGLERHWNERAKLILSLNCHGIQW